ncbi:hypothetical protein NKG94_11275 [Micromonospora sp. M12]
MLELAIHVIPMVVGVWMSLLELTQFHIRDWSTAPFVGLENYRATLDLNSAAGKELLHSFWITLAYSLLSVGFAWLLGISAAVVLQRPFRGGRSCGRCSSPVRAAGLRRRDHLELPAATRHRPGQPRARGPARAARRAAVLADRRQQLLVAAGGVGLAQLAVRVPLPDGRAAERARRDVRGRRDRRRRVLAPPALGHPADAAAGEPGAAAGAVPVDLQRLQHPFVLFGGSAPEQADLISIHIYRSSFKTWDFGSGSAMSVALLLFLMVVSAAYLLITNRRRDDHA